jgi:hypothetical protein
MSRALWWPAALLGAGVLGYAALAARAWLRYGTNHPPDPLETDPLLDRHMPVYDVVERHRIAVDAPPDITLAAAREMRLEDSAIVRMVFQLRELVMGGEVDGRGAPKALEARMREIGWGVLDEIPGREIVFGAVTAPWEANPVFHPLPAESFVSFAQPGLVRIAWTLRADAAGGDASTFRSETRAHPTDADARARFRRYWAFVSPGVWTIRRLMLRPVKLEAERRWRLMRASADTVH